MIKTDQITEPLSKLMKILFFITLVFIGISGIALAADGLAMMILSKVVSLFFLVAFIVGLTLITFVVFGLLATLCEIVFLQYVVCILSLCSLFTILCLSSVFPRISCNLHILAHRCCHFHGQQFLFGCFPSAFIA